MSSDYRFGDLVKVFAVRRVCAGALPHDRCAYVLHRRPSEASILASIDQEESRHHETRLLNVSAQPWLMKSR